MYYFYSVSIISPNAPIKIKVFLKTQAKLLILLMVLKKDFCGTRLAHLELPTTNVDYKKTTTAKERSCRMRAVNLD